MRGAVLFRQWFTGLGNESFELGRALWAVGVLALIGYQGAALFFLKQAFSPTEFGIGFGAVMAAGGVGIAAKDSSSIKMKGVENVQRSDG